MLNAPRTGRSRLLAACFGAALLAALSIGPAGAQTPAGSALPAAGGTLVGKVVQAYADPRTIDARREVQAKPLTRIEPASGPAVRVAAPPGSPLPLGATVKATVGTE